MNKIVLIYAFLQLGSCAIIANGGNENGSPGSFVVFLAILWIIGQCMNMVECFIYSRKHRTDTRKIVIVNMWLIFLIGVPALSLITMLLFKSYGR